MRRAGSEVGLTLAVLAASPAIRAEVAARGGLSGREIAEICGCSDAYISNVTKQAMRNALSRFKKEGLDIADFVVL